jgi:hypothetical protein
MKDMERLRGCILLVLCVSVFGQVGWQGDRQFRQYAVQSRVGSENLGSADLAPIIIGRREGEESKKQFMDRIRSSAGRRSNYAASYAIVQWSCGMACADSAIVNVRSGHVEFLPFTVTKCRFQEGAQLDYRADSRLLVASGELEWRPSDTGETRVEPCSTHYFIWTGTLLKRVKPAESRR